MTVQVLPAGGSMIRKALGLNITLPIHALVAVVDGVPVCAGGLTWGLGRCWLWFHVEQPARVGLVVLRQAKRLLKVAVQLGECEVYTVRDPQFATSSRLLAMLGFEPHGFEEGQEVHVWRL